MIVIDTSAETKLIKLLEQLRLQMDSTRCLEFKLRAISTDHTEQQRIKQIIIHAAQQHLPASQLQLFVCEDEIFVIAPVMSTKEANGMMLSVGEAIQQPVNDNWVEFFDAALQANRLLVAFEHKALQRERALHAAELQKAMEKAQQRREHILTPPVTHKLKDITLRRSQRSQPHIMIIEDDEFTCKLVENVLQKQYEITALHTTESALLSYVNIAPNILFLDINLPDVTGHDLLRRIIGLDPDAYVVMLSGNSDRENIMQALSLGAKGFIAKPFTRDKIIQYIERCPTVERKS